MSKSHLIITAADEGCGNFLVNHWLASLRDNVDLTNIDVVVLDYGLNLEQRERLRAKGITSIPCDRSGIHIVWARWRDTAEFLRQTNFDQVLAVDGGDVIFQSDISHLFTENQEHWRAACEEIDSSFHDLFMKRDDFGKEEWNRIGQYLKGKPIINSGFVLGPAKKFQTLWPFFQEWTLQMHHHGGDQLLCNYYLYQNGFIPLDIKYNLVLITTRRSHFKIKDGVFYDGRGKVIPVVHNAAATQGLVENFGYGTDCNKLKKIRQIRCHAGLAWLGLYKKFLNLIIGQNKQQPSK